MSTTRPDQDYLQASDPNTGPADLHAIAIRRPDLWPLIATHPNVYPELASWIRQEQQQHFSADQTEMFEPPGQTNEPWSGRPPVSDQTGQYSDVTEVDQYPPQSFPGDELPRKRNLLPWLAAVAAVAVVGLVAGAYFLLIAPSKVRRRTCLPLLSIGCHRRGAWLT